MSRLEDHALLCVAPELVVILLPAANANVNAVVDLIDVDGELMTLASLESVVAVEVYNILIICDADGNDAAAVRYGLRHCESVVYYRLLAIVGLAAVEARVDGGRVASILNLAILEVDSALAANVVDLHLLDSIAKLLEGEALTSLESQTHQRHLVVSGNANSVVGRVLVLRLTPQELRSLITVHIALVLLYSEVVIVNIINTGVRVVGIEVCTGVLILPVDRLIRSPLLALEGEAHICNVALPGTEVLTLVNNKETDTVTLLVSSVGNTSLEVCSDVDSHLALVRVNGCDCDRL
jgi:hypothetical protein